MLKSIKPRLTKRIISLLAALALALPLAITTMSSTVYASDGYPKIVYTTSQLYVYIEPDICSDRLANLEKGTQLTATEKITGDPQFTFLKVEYNGIIGYVDESHTTEETVAATDWEAVAAAWEAAGMEDYAAVIRAVKIDKTLSVEDLDWDQQSALVGATLMPISATDGYDAYAEEAVDAVEAYGNTLSDEAEAIADTVIAQLTNDSMSDYEKAIVIYNWMCANISYDHAGVYRENYEGASALAYDKSATDVLTTGTAVCQGYADTFHMFMDKLGVSCVEVFGHLGGTTEANAHAWNLVKIDGQWYHVDVTNGRFLFSDDAATAWGYTDWRQIHSCPSNYGE